MTVLQKSNIAINYKVASCDQLWRLGDLAIHCRLDVGTSNQHGSNEDNNIKNQHQ